MITGELVSLAITLFFVLLGAVLTLAIGFLVANPILDRATVELTPQPPKPLKLADWQRIVSPPSGIASAWLGRIESLLLFAAFWIQSPELVAAWLIFKVGSKWEIWANIVQVPKHVDGVKDLELLRSRYHWASRVFARFIIGTALNILVALSVAYLLKGILRTLPLLPLRK